MVVSSFTRHSDALCGEVPFGPFAGRACQESAMGNLKLSDSKNIIVPGLLECSGALPPLVKWFVLHK